MDRRTFSGTASNAGPFAPIALSAQILIGAPMRRGRYTSAVWPVRDCSVTKSALDAGAI